MPPICTYFSNKWIKIFCLFLYWNTSTCETSLVVKRVPSRLRKWIQTLSMLWNRKLYCLNYVETWILKGQCFEMDIYFEGLNILISTFCVCADGFKVLQKLFTTLSIQLFNLFNCFFEISYSFWKCLLKPSRDTIPLTHGNIQCCQKAR